MTDLQLNVKTAQFVTKDAQQQAIENETFQNESKSVNRFLLHAAAKMSMTFKAEASGEITLTQYVSGHLVEQTIPKSRLARLGLSIAPADRDHWGLVESLPKLAIVKKRRVKTTGAKNHISENLSVLPWQNQSKPEQSFVIPVVNGLSTSSSFERWRGTLEALTHTGGIVSIHVQKFHPTGRITSYARQVVAALQENFDTLLFQDDLKRDTEIYRCIAEQDNLYAVQIEVSHTEYAKALAFAVLQDIDPNTLCLSIDNPALNTQNIAHPEIQDFIQQLPHLFMQEEVLDLLMLPYTFGDALPGLAHYIAKPFTKPALAQQHASSPKIHLGRLLDQSPIHSYVANLNLHTLVTGMTRSGKSHTAHKILLEIKKQLLSEGQDIPILIIDPAKCEYETLMRTLGHPDRIIDFKEGRFLRFNPFIPQPNIAVYAHASILAKAFSLLCPTNDVAFEIILNMVRYIYHDKLQNMLGEIPLEKFLQIDGAFLRSHPQCIPTFDEFLDSGLAWLKDSVTRDGKMDRWGQEAVSHFERRWASVRMGICAYIFSGTEPVDRYFEFDYLIELYNILDSSESNTVFALLVAMLHEYRLSHGLSKTLQHVTVIEEAHRIIPSQQAGLGENRVSSSAHEAATLLAQMLAEIGGFGEGLIIVDQSPSKILPDVLINCSTKLIHRTQYGKDKEILGSALSLCPRESAHLSYLATGEAIAFMAGASQPAYIQVAPH